MTMGAKEGPPRIQPGDLRAMRREVATAGDALVLRILRLVDSLDPRGDADELLAPVRGRLRVLRPPRRLRFTRLLFLPLDPLIVDPQQWRAGAPLLPRTALNPLSGVVRSLLPEMAARIDALAREGATTDANFATRVGPLLWPEAALALESATMPSGWVGEGLPASSFAPLAKAVAFCLGAEAALAALELPGVPRGEIETVLIGLLDEADTRGPLCGAMLLSLAVQRFPTADAPIRAALARSDGAGAGKAALDLAMAWVEISAEQQEAGDLRDATDEVRRQVAILEKMSDDPSRRQRATELRVALQASCAQRFKASVQELVAAKVGPLPASGADALLETVERDARNLRLFESQARRLGGGAVYDEQLHAIAKAVTAQAGWARFDRVRLVEILVGAREAMQLLAALPP